MQKLTTFALIVVCLCSAYSVDAQCYLDRHNTSQESHWSSCSPSPNPNPANNNGHWILYEFDQDYPLYQLHYWNYNHPSDLDMGIQSVQIEVSEDGLSWLDMGTHTFDQADGSGFYEGADGPNLGGIQARYLLLTALSNYGDNQCYGLGELRIDVEGVQAPQLLVDIKVKLSGTYNPTTGLMQDQLRVKGLIPLQEPYASKASFIHTESGGGEQVSSTTVFDNDLDEDDIVDWVFVELRNSDDPNIIVQSKSALLQRDGDIVDLDGQSVLSMQAEANEYFISVRHRNHLGIMTAQEYSILLNEVISVDLTDNPSNVFGNQLFEFSDGSFGMYGANVNGENASIAANKHVRMTGPASINDFAALLLALDGDEISFVQDIYNDADINMDGNIRMTGPASINDFARMLLILGGDEIALLSQNY